MQIPMLDLSGQYQHIKYEIDEAIREVLDQGTYIMGPELKEFEDNIADFLGVKYAIGVASGSDALLLSLHALGIGPGDKVIVPTFTFFATAGAVSRLGGIPVFVDIDSYSYNLNLDQVETILQKNKNVKAIVPVHLFGLPCDMNRIMALSEKYGVFIVEDACQAINADAICKERVSKTGTIGHTGCFSFFPSKNLGAYGDGGMVVTNDDNLAQQIRILRAHGSNPKYYHKIVGYNSRLDTIQAAVLNVKLKYLDDWTQKRVAVASQYNCEFKSCGLADKIVCPQIQKGHVFHQYVIQVDARDDLAVYMKEKGIGTSVYYPLPLHLQECFTGLGFQEGDLPVSEAACHRVLALPIDPELTEEQIKYIVGTIQDFFERVQKK